MSLAKKCDIRNRLSAGRNKSQHSFRPVDLADQTNPSSETDGTRVKRLTFAEDFMLEHTSSSLCITLFGMADDTETVPGEQQHMPTQYYGFPS